jgi:DNA-binding CsgD family transcriptional regulator
MAEWRALVAEGDRSAARIVLAEVERGAQAAARRLDISSRTHGANILAKLAVHSQLRAVLFALRHGAVDLR